MNVPPVPDELAVAILPRIVSAACALEDGNAAEAHSILIDLELDLAAWQEAA